MVALGALTPAAPAGRTDVDALPPWVVAVFLFAFVLLVTAIAVTGSLQ